ncbi:head completion/stabilization protein [Pseudomonas sp.]|uniref:head completion/stabilization protein n=1 Tax=Pseudomonas sp. TaxID=306 RepID=UPI0028AE2096|nr:head completion/stabilization protein [Pseudomonas sp.]
MNAEASDPATCLRPGARYADDHDPFWPRTELHALRGQLGLDESVTDAQLQLAARSAAITAAREFAQWRRVLRDRGFKRLEDIAAHAPGRVLSRCYRECLKRATRCALAHTSCAQTGPPEVVHD